jgi:hypothetical protein
LHAIGTLAGHEAIGGGILPHDVSIFRRKTIVDRWKRLFQKGREESLVAFSYRKVVWAVCGCLFLLLIPSTEPLGQSATSPDAVVITIGDLKLTAGEVEKISRFSLPPQNGNTLQAPRAAPRLQNLVRTKLFVREAEKRHWRIERM